MREARGVRRGEHDDLGRGHVRSPLPLDHLSKVFNPNLNTALELNGSDQSLQCSQSSIHSTTSRCPFSSAASLHAALDQGHPSFTAH